MTVGEHRHVERKRQLPDREPLAAAVASLANSEGGWLLIGVDDDGQVPGLPAMAAELQDHLRHLLTGQVDPLPNFVARRASHDGVDIGVVRVYASSDTPHLCTHNGAIYLRDPGGRRGIASRYELDRLVARGAGSSHGAAARMARAAVIPVALEAPELAGAASYEESMEREWVLRAAPVAVDDRFAVRALGAEAEAAARAAAERVIPPRLGHDGDEYDDFTPVSNGWMVRRHRVGDRAAAAVAVDPAGAVAVMVRERGKRSVVNLQELVPGTIEPMVAVAADLLEVFGSGGRFVCDFHARGFRGVLVQDLNGGGAEQVKPGLQSSGTQVVSGGAAAPSAAMRLGVELARAIGVNAHLP